MLFNSSLEEIRELREILRIIIRTLPADKPLIYVNQTIKKIVDHENNIIWQYKGEI